MSDGGLSIERDDGSVFGAGCEDRFEFEFALDLMLDGLERMRSRGANDYPC